MFISKQETKLVECIALPGEWGLLLTNYDLRLMIKSLLQLKGLNEKKFRNNLPKPDWIKQFLIRNRYLLTQRLWQNIKRCRVNVDADMINKCFDEPETS